MIGRVKGRRHPLSTLSAVAALLLTTLAGYRWMGPGDGADQTVLNATASRLDQDLRESFPGSFAGLEGDDADRGLIIYRQQDVYLDRYVRVNAGAVPVQFRNAPSSLSDLTPLVDRVYADVAYWRERDIEIQYIGTRIDGSGVNVLLFRGDRAAATLAFRQRYGDDRIKVVEPGGDIQLTN